MSLRILLGSLVLVGLGGCASAPAQKPLLPDSQYVLSARDWHTIHQCGFLGHIDPETVSLSRAYFLDAIQQYRVDESRFESEVVRLNQKQTPVSKEQCLYLAVETMDRKRQIANNQQAADYNQRALQDFVNTTKPRQTLCNRIGPQVFCNSY